MIEITDLHKAFDGREVLKGITSTFENGKTNLIIGQSGSGKTVLMKCIVGLFTPTAGDVVYDGRSFVGMTKRERALLRREMGMIFQSAALFDSMSVLENVMFPLDMFSNDSYKERPSPSSPSISSATNPTPVSTPRHRSSSTNSSMSSRRNITRPPSLTPTT